MGKGRRLKTCKEGNHLNVILKYYKKVPGMKRSGALLMCSKCGIKHVSIFDFTEKEILKQARDMYKKWKKKKN